MKKVKIYVIMLYVKILKGDTMMSIIMFLCVMLFIPLNVNALHEVIDSRCTNALKTSIREEANDVVYRLSKVESNNEVTYTAYFYNSTNNLDLYLNDNIIYNDKIENLKPGSNIVVTIYSSNNNYCATYKAKTLMINVPSYNRYFGTEACSGYDDFYLCQEHSKVNMTEEEFNKKLNEYKENLVSDKSDDEKIDVEEVKQNNNLLSFISEYKYYFIGVIGFAILFVVIDLIKKNKSKRGIL